MAGQQRLEIEARLGELIKIEQEAGRSAISQTGNPELKCSNVATLSHYGLTRTDSSRRKKIEEHEELKLADVDANAAQLATEAIQEVKTK